MWSLGVLGTRLPRLARFWALLLFSYALQVSLGLTKPSKWKLTLEVLPPKCFFFGLFCFLLPVIITFCNFIKAIAKCFIQHFKFFHGRIYKDLNHTAEKRSLHIIYSLQNSLQITPPQNSITPVKVSLDSIRISLSLFLINPHSKLESRVEYSSCLKYFELTWDSEI